MPIRVLLVAACVFAALPAAAEEKWEGEELRVIRCTSGETTVWKMEEEGFAEPGLFSGGTSLYWHDAAEAGAVLELALPVEKPGRYALSVGLARYRTFGTFQFLVNGKAAGAPVDMYGNPGADGALPFSVTLGTFTLEAGDNVLALRLTGTNKDTIMANHGGAVDWVKTAYQGPVVETGGTGGGGVSGKPKTYEADKLRVVFCTSGETTVWKMVEDGFAEPGQFSGGTSLYWHDAAEVGAVLELALPVEKAGRYALSVGLVRYRTFGKFQFLVNGKKAGDPVDMYGHPEVDAASPFTVPLGTFTLAAGANVLALRLVGTNPNTVMPNHGAGIDWIRLTPAPAPPKPGKKE
jgi:hypothetical protein